MRTLSRKLLGLCTVFVAAFSTVFPPAAAIELTKQQRQRLLSQGILHYYSFQPRLEKQSQRLIWPMTSPTFSAIIDFYGSKLTFDMRLNDGLVHKSFSHSYQQGQEQKNIQGLAAPFCYYHGKIREGDEVQDHIAMAACRGLEGTFEYRGHNYAIQPIDDEVHVLYRTDEIRNRASDDSTRQHRCDSALAGNSIDRKKLSRYIGHRRLRRNVINETKYLELVLVNDKRSFDLFSGNLATLESHTIQVANNVDLRYKTIQVRVALMSIVTWSAQDQIAVTADASETLSQFANYSSRVLKYSHPYDSAQLLTGITLNGKSGLGYVSTICLANAVGITHNSQNVEEVASILSHELGHVFGMNHDNGRTCSCVHKPSSATICIMSGVLMTPFPQSFSSCSVSDLHKSLREGLGSCLFNRPTKLATPQQCGNGFLETGEECDCGTLAECNNPCCNAETCKLQPRAQCASGPCCHNCQYKAKSTLCRGAVNDCDLPEYCSGNSEQCPPNVVKQNSLQCSNSTGYCYNGACLTINSQCQTLWGPTGSDAPNICWDRINVLGNEYGYCQKTSGGSYIGCNPVNVRCGKLHCTTSASSPAIGSTWRLATVQFNQGGVYTTCKSISIDLGNDIPDPGVVYDGTRCGNEKICFKQECQNIRSVLNIQECNPIDCSNHGICNSNGHCHCDSGFAPPDCIQPGQGGSVDSHGNQSVADPTSTPSQTFATQISTLSDSTTISSTLISSSMTLSSTQSSSSVMPSSSALSSSTISFSSPVSSSTTSVLTSSSVTLSSMFRSSSVPSSSVFPSSSITSSPMFSSSSETSSSVFSSSSVTSSSEFLSSSVTSSSEFSSRSAVSSSVFSSSPETSSSVFLSSSATSSSVFSSSSVTSSSMFSSNSATSSSVFSSSSVPSSSVFSSSSVPSSSVFPSSSITSSSVFSSSSETSSSVFLSSSVTSSSVFSSNSKISSSVFSSSSVTSPSVLSSTLISSSLVTTSVTSSSRALSSSENTETVSSIASASSSYKTQTAVITMLSPTTVSSQIPSISSTSYDMSIVLTTESITDEPDLNSTETTSSLPTETPTADTQNSDAIRLLHPAIWMISIIMQLAVILLN